MKYFNQLKSISFFRNYHSYTGGHQKVLDYMQHALALEKYKCKLYIQNGSKEKTIFDNLARVSYQKKYSPQDADIVFLAGLDWGAYLPHAKDSQQKICLVQHLRHADPECEHFYFLQHSALRICVSQAVCDAISPYANGPCIHIPMGYDFPKIDNTIKNTDVYILAKKRPGVGRVIADWCAGKGLKVKLHDRIMPKADVLNAMADANLSVLLPNQTEGFYLPGIEAMYFSNKVLMTDCIANREYTGMTTNATLCGFDLASILQKLDELLSKSHNSYLGLGASQTEKNVIKEKYSIDKEREYFQSLLMNLNFCKLD